MNVVHLRLPDLRERLEDILLLAHNFLVEESQKLGRRQTSFSPAAIAAITAHDWPGNVRELQNRIRRALGTTSGRVLNPVDLGLEDATRLLSGPVLPKLERLPLRDKNHPRGRPALGLAAGVRRGHFQGSFLPRSADGRLVRAAGAGPLGRAGRIPAPGGSKFRG